jgi:hypothetical protein
MQGWQASAHMKFTLFGTFLSFIFLTSLSAQTPDSLKFPTQCSVEQTVTTSGASHKTKLFMDGEKMRMEINAQGMDMISIVRKDKKLVYTLMPAQKMYMEIPFNQESVKEVWKDPEAKFVAVGTENIKNQACTKYKLTLKADEYFLWVNPTTKLPVRQSSADGKTVIDWDSFKPGPQAADLFELPADYKKMGM